MSADIIIYNVNGFTANPAQPYAEAVAIQGQKIVFVGSLEAALTWRAPHTRLIDGQGCTLMPGFIDSHYHLELGSLDLDSIQLTEVRNMAQLTEAVQSYAADNPDLPWLVGQGLTYTVTIGHEPLTRQVLDELVFDRPLLIFAYDTHTAWANTAALRRGNLLQNGQIISPNSEIVLGVDGLANGELREPGAYKPLLNLIPPHDEAKRRVLVKRGLAAAAKLGVTSVHNMDGNLAQMQFYQELASTGELTLRVYVPLDIKPETPIEALAEAVAMRAASSALVRGGSVKFFMDGVIESFTGLLLEGYAEQPGNLGGALFEVDHFNDMATAADKLGLQIFVHAVGDGAVRRTLDGFEVAQKINGRRDSRHRVEHVELIHPDDVGRFAQLEVIASMQPAHAPMHADDSDVWPSRLGTARWGYSFAWQTLRQAGARLAFGSDWPVTTISPFTGIYTAMNRRPWANDLPDQRQTLPDTLMAYTQHAAYAEFQETVKGQLQVGQWADVVLLSDNLFRVPPDAIDQVTVWMTICDGRVVYES